MGRYYNFDSGREGKFAFGVQSSTDPGDVFGMEEAGSSTIEYYMKNDEEHKQMVKDKINEQYEILGVPASERRYEFKDDDDKHEYLGNIWDKYCVKIVPTESLAKGQMPYALTELQEAKLKAEGKNPRDYSAINNGSMPLADARVRLGLNILAEMEEQAEEDYINMTAEC